MLLLGQFNYGKHGILDMTHTRLFTFYSLRELLEQRGFQVLEIRGIPAPFPVALGNNTKPLPRGCKQGVLSTEAHIVFLSNTCCGSAETVVGVAFATSARRIFRARR